jgi:hypothetical protein
VLLENYAGVHRACRDKTDGGEALFCLSSVAFGVHHQLLFITAVPNIKLFARREGGSGGHVL